MTPEENKRLVHAAYTGEGGGPSLIDLLDDDATYTFFGSHRFATTMHGKQAILDQLLLPLSTALENGITLTIHNMVAEGDQVVFEATGSARTRDGRAYDNSYCMVVRLQDGRIRSVREYLDTELVSRIFG
jgi:ketosteroid isomerase-like protein